MRKQKGLNEVIATLLQHLQHGHNIFEFCNTLEKFGSATIKDVLDIDKKNLKIELALHKKMKLSIKDFFSKCDQIRRLLRFGHVNWRNP